MNPHNEKTCSKCQIPKPLDQFSKRGFSKRGTTKDGLNKWCRGCIREYDRAWRARNRNSKSYELNFDIKKRPKQQKTPETVGMWTPPPFLVWKDELKRFIRVVPKPEKIIEECSNTMRAITQRYDVNPYLSGI